MVDWTMGYLQNQADTSSAMGKSNWTQSLDLGDTLVYLNQNEGQSDLIPISRARLGTTQLPTFTDVRRS